MGSPALETSITLLCYLCIENIQIDLNVENYGITPVFTALSGILRVHGIAPEYKYHTVFLE